MLVESSYHPSQIIEANQIAIYTLSKYNINKGDKSDLKTICDELKINVNFIIDLIHQSDLSRVKVLDTFRYYDLLVLIDYLEKSHIFYKNKLLPKIEQYINHIVLLSNNENKLLSLVKDVFKRFEMSLIEHFYVEEKNLFVYAKYLYHLNKSTFNRYQVMNYVNLFSLEEFQDAHPKTEKDLDLLERALTELEVFLSDKLVYNALINTIKDFKRDLELHAIIEDFVLISKVSDMRQKI